MKIKMILMTGLMALFPIVAGAQQTKILTAEKHNEYGLIYTLPVTAFDVEVIAEKEMRQAGPYYQYAKKYIGTDKVIKENAEIWTIKSVKLRPYGVPDPDERYLMQLKAGATTFIGVDADGMLLSINKNPETTEVEKTQTDGFEGERLKDREYLQYVDEDFIASQSSAKQAQMLAENLMEIRDSKLALTRGTADVMPTDGKQLEIMLNSLAHQELALTAAFVGNTTKETVVRNFTFVPSDNGKTVLFRMSNFAGFVDANDYSGDPVYVNVEVTNQGELPVDSKGEVKRLPKDAVVYCVPGTAEISVDFLGKTLYDKEFEVAQFGVTFGLDPSLFTDKKAPSYAIFDPATGAVKELGTLKE